MISKIGFVVTAVVEVTVTGLSVVELLCGGAVVCPGPAVVVVASTVVPTPAVVVGAADVAMVTVGALVAAAVSEGGAELVVSPPSPPQPAASSRKQVAMPMRVRKAGMS
jgi:hypothetical protein